MTGNASGLEIHPSIQARGQASSCWTNHHLVTCDLETTNGVAGLRSNAEPRDILESLEETTAAACVSDLPADARPSAVRLSSDGKTTALPWSKARFKCEKPRRESCCARFHCPTSKRPASLSFRPMASRLQLRCMSLKGVQSVRGGGGRRAFVCRDNELQSERRAVSPDGKWLAAGVRVRASCDSGTRRRATLAEPLLVGDVTGVSSCWAFARDGKALSVGGRSRGNGLFVANWPARQPVVFTARPAASRFYRWFTRRILGSLPRVGWSASRCICGTREPELCNWKCPPIAGPVWRFRPTAGRARLPPDRLAKVSPVDDRHRRRSDRCDIPGIAPVSGDITPASRCAGWTRLRSRWNDGSDSPNGRRDRRRAAKIFQHFHRASNDAAWPTRRTAS